MGGRARPARSLPAGAALPGAPGHLGVRAPPRGVNVQRRTHMTRIAYFNGKFVPETEVMIPYRDRSFNRGDGCFDMTRTFDGRIFRLEEHVERLFRSLRYLRIDIGLEPKEVVA